MSDDIALLRGQIRVLEMVATGAPLPSVLAELIALVEAREPGLRCGILVLAADGERFAQSFGPNLPDAYHTALAGLPITPPYRGACGEVAHLGVPVVVPDVARETRYPDAWRGLLVSHGLAALRSTPVRGPDGRVLASLVLYYDRPCDSDPADPRWIELATRLAAIALRREAERDAARASEARLRANADAFYGLVQNMPFGIYVVDADFRVAQASQSALAVFGIDTLIGTDLAVALRKIWPEPFASEAIGRFRHTLATGERYVAKDTVEQRADIDAVEAYDWRIERVVMPDGRFGVVCYFYDLSERQRMEAALRASERRFAALFEQAPTFMAMLRGPDHVIEIANPGYLKLVGQREVIGRAVADALPDAVAQGYLELLDRVYRSGEPYSARGAKFVSQPIPGGPVNERYVDFVYQPITDASGAVSGIFVEGFDVTDRVEAERRLVESEERHRLTIESARDYAIVTLDMEGVIIGWNAGAQRVMGYTEAEAIGQPGAIFFTPEDREAGADKLEMDRARAEGRSENERWHVRKDGSRFWGSGLVMPLGDGHQRGCVKIFQDKTAEHEARRRLEQAVADLQEAQRVSHVGSWVWDADTDATRGSDELYRIYGLDPESGGFPNFREQRGWLYPVESWERINEAVQCAVDTGLGYELDVEAFRGADPIWITTRCAVVRSEGRVIGLRGTVQDITARKRAEAALRESEARLQAILATAPVGIVLAEAPSGRILFGNAAIEGMLRHPIRYSSDVDGYLEWEAYHADGRRVAGHEYPLGRVLATGEPASGEYQYVCGDGVRRWISVNGAPIRDETGRLTGAVVVCADIDELKRAEAVLARDKEGLERLVAERTRDLTAAQGRLAHAQRMEALGQLAGGIAHDFNNIIQAVQGGAGLIRRRASDPQAVDHLARMVEDAAQRGASVTRRLLSFARRGELRAETVDAASLLDDLHEVLAHTLGAGIRVRTEVAAANLPALTADKGQLETVLVNLAANARDAMPRGGTLTLSAVEDVIGRAKGARDAPDTPPPGRYVRLAVSDTGEGMAAEVLARASEPFFTTKPRGQGTGLGLAMARGFAEQSGGALAIRSAPGAGTTVTIWLPAALKGPGTPDGGGRPPRDEAAPRSGRRARILVVDDEALVREVLAAGLEEHGYEALHATSGQAALAMLDAGASFDLLLTDYAMPGMDGLSLVEEARRRVPDLPAVLLTGNANGQVEATLALSGAAGEAFTLLRKPVGADQLAERVQTLLAEAGAKPGAGGVLQGRGPLG